LSRNPTRQKLAQEFGATDILTERGEAANEGAWFRQAQQGNQGRISSGRMTKDVTFVDVSKDEALNHQIDAAYPIEVPAIQCNVC
jgi:hypothetical protein